MPPEADGVNVTVQVPRARVQAVELKVPTAPELPKLTMPVGVLDGPSEVSATVAEHVLPCPITTEDTHVTTVEVLRLLIVIVKAPELVA